MPRSIAVIGTVDTKGDQIEYLNHQIENRGHKTTVIDVGVLGAVPFKPSIIQCHLRVGFSKSIKELMILTLPGMETFRENLMKNIKPDIKVVALDVGFNDPPYAEAVLDLFDEMMSKQSHSQTEWQ